MAAVLRREEQQSEKGDIITAAVKSRCGSAAERDPEMIQEIKDCKFQPCAPSLSISNGFYKAPFKFRAVRIILQWRGLQMTGCSLVSMSHFHSSL